MEEKNKNDIGGGELLGETEGVESLENLPSFEEHIKEINEAGKDSEWDENGINKKTGTKFDEEGYGQDGFDDIGVDREGFDREGFGTDERDREGYDKEGYDRHGFNRDGWNREGINRFTGTELDYYGYDKDGYNMKYKRGFNDKGINKKTGTEFDEDGWNLYGRDQDGFDRKGRDESGYDREGFDERGWNRDGINKETGTKFDEDGFDKEGYDGEGFGRNGYDREGFNRNDMHRSGNSRAYINQFGNGKYRYDKDGHSYRRDPNFVGYDRDGYDPDGYNKWGYDRRGYDKEGYDPKGYDKEGYDKEGWSRERINKKTGTKFDEEGFDEKGYNEKGFNIDGFDEKGFNENGIDKDGYNSYGLNSEGYDREGKLDEDVELALKFADSGIRSMPDYAAENKMSLEEVNKRIGNARKKSSKVNERVSEVLATGNKQRVAMLFEETEEYVDGKIGFSEYWEKHPRLTANVVCEQFVKDDKRSELCLKTMENMALDVEHIDENINIFSSEKYNVKDAIKNLEAFKKEIGRVPADDEELLKRRKASFSKLFKAVDYFKKYQNTNWNGLIGERRSFDNGETWIEFTEEKVKAAVDELHKNKKLVSYLTVSNQVVKTALNK